MLGEEIVQGFRVVGVGRGGVERRNVEIGMGRGCGGIWGRRAEGAKERREGPG